MEGKVEARAVGARAAAATVAVEKEGEVKAAVATARGLVSRFSSLLCGECDQALAIRA